MNFIRRIGRDEIYIKYVHQLVNVSRSLPLCRNMQLTHTFRCICKVRTTWRLLWRWNCIRISMNGICTPSSNPWRNLGYPNSPNSIEKKPCAYWFWTILVCCSFETGGYLKSLQNRQGESLGKRHRNLQRALLSTFRGHLQLVSLFATSCSPY